MFLGLNFFVLSLGRSALRAHKALCSHKAFSFWHKIDIMKTVVGEYAGDYGFPLPNPVSVS
ncbi:MAG: hypothetical protein A2626_02165 [Candidatus Nealsonbacteria bacterium RIFCSPHIGHO2_01_FULL_38_55]|uniref:Uncharacterized protein n=1 Tax=Candidatus Nealsonbacteria bacterium RIFCSPHIGHO2_01_FULL_38_55 TaxID=1801664 RepID=A0A1G2E0T1_9BACT|nr:MAG: hypothetical protein A2626_02165 [Candidatus Nealsonbacteria bacterium RIFCSPHIGHO2_01_FULL_38_55]OGZ21560.1 MAG: hypothetical protein A3C48_01890 [Candidatus Nealsonbacteria bacterium RIFCSPHIGHO2_02_FULL_38_75]OGZ23319.1 MAG: hypothetical protein A2981_02995 [Candidatus Nealsonbacteria bacterium RIFCSPLOWO2_01_FULL_38_120]OGZ26490.1 MAG: hypothetical protein A3I85_03215 [Candidatus Nealsonbacteria bacterium RIFCSPLOWO2_02_FULL_38_63]